MFWVSLPVKLQDSNYCFNSLAIRLRSLDLKHLIPGNGYPNYRVSINDPYHYFCHFRFVQPSSSMRRVPSLAFLNSGSSSSSNNSTNSSNNSNKPSPPGSKFNQPCLGPVMHQSCWFCVGIISILQFLRKNLSSKI